MTGICSAHRGHDPACPQCNAIPELVPDVPADAITAAQDVLTCNCDPGPEGQHQPWCDKLTPLLRLLEAAAPALRAQGATAAISRIRAGVDRIRETCHTPFSRALLDEFADLLDGGGDA